MVLEETRFIHEDLERLEQAISDRIAEDPRHTRDRLWRDHQISDFLSRIRDQSQRLLDIYGNIEGRTKEIQAISTGDPFDEFYKQFGQIRDFHRRYPNEPVENLERAYKKKVPVEGESASAELDNLFSGEEAWGKFLDLTTNHEQYLNLPNIKRVSYIQYLDNFDVFTPPQCSVKRAEKTTDQYFTYVKGLAAYLEDFMKRTKPLEGLEKLFASFDRDFNVSWDHGTVPGWGKEKTQAASAAPPTEGMGEGIWCSDCEKEFKNDNVYKAHLSGKKHVKAAAARKWRSAGDDATTTDKPTVTNLKERAVAEREYRISRLAAALSSVRADTRVNVERRQGMTERERQQELETLYADTADTAAPHDSDEEDDGDERIYNPLKLPLAWDGKPIPFWLYKLHGLGVEFKCEVCGGFVYMGRRAFDKHFSEARHVYGLKCLGITNTSLFREITSIEDAVKLWEKLQRDKKSEETQGKDIVQMEDADGNVMPEKVYLDLQKQGLL